MSNTQIKADVPKPIGMPNPNTQTIEQRLAELEAKVDELSVRLYIGYYRYGNRPPATKVFRCRGTRRDADTFFRDHCDRSGYKFCGVYAFIVDVEEQERMRNDEDNSQFYSG